MARLRTTLVLGAGASSNYGFPLGDGLAKQILALRPDDAPAQLALEGQTLGDFIDAFRRSAAISIDSFLARRPEFSTVGKRAIARTIMQYEDVEILRAASTNGSTDHWYRLLTHALYQQSWEELDLSWLSIVTFNYDRSLEMFLLDTMMANYGVQEDEATEVLREMDIHHVYGSFGPVAGPSRVEYSKDNIIKPRIICQAAERLQVIPEGRDDDKHLEPIQEVVADSERVAFLGFAFDAQNLRRLGFPSNGVKWPRLFGATGKGMTPAEQHLAFTRMTTESSPSAFGWVIGTCTDFLRHHAFLEY